MTHPWIQHAQREEGTRETVNGKNNPRIHDYFQATGFKAGEASDAWCSAFANWCMKQAGIKGTNSAAAQSWLRWGVELPLTEPRPGCIVVFSRPTPTNPNSGHVAFYVRSTRGYIHVLGGNQNNRVCVRPYPSSRLLGYRWPEGVP